MFLVRNSSHTLSRCRARSAVGLGHGCEAKTVFGHGYCASRSGLLSWLNFSSLRVLSEPRNLASLDFFWHAIHAWIGSGSGKRPRIHAQTGSSLVFWALKRTAPVGMSHSECLTVTGVIGRKGFCNGRDMVWLVALRAVIVALQVRSIPEGASIWRGWSTRAWHGQYWLTGDKRCHAKWGDFGEEGATREVIRLLWAAHRATSVEATPGSASTSCSCGRQLRIGELA